MAALLSAECGGNDVIDSGDASTDGPFDHGLFDTGADARLADRLGDTSAADSRTPDGETNAEAALHDGEGGSASAMDAGLVEGGGVEAGLVDAGFVDAGLADAGLADAGLADAGLADAGDADGGAQGGGVAAPALGTAKTFALLASATITNTGVATAVVGDVGISPGTALVGLTPGQVTGTIHLADAVAMQAEADATTAYNNLAGRPCQTTMTSVDLGGKTLPPGVYCFAVAAAQMVGDLTLDGQGDANAVWIFQIGSTLTIASNLSTTMINGGNACNVYWQVGSSATVNGGAQFKGNILAQASVSLLTGASVSPGRVFAQTAAVTMQSNAISNAGCP